MLKQKYISLLISGLFLGGIGLPHAYAQTQDVQGGSARKTYHIEQNTLSFVLSSFAAQSGVPLGFNPSMLDGWQSAGLQGTYSVEEGFRALLDKTPYHVIKDKNGYTIINKTATSAQGVLGSAAIASASGSELPTIVIRSEEDMYRTAGSVHQITQKDLERVPYSRPGDIFAGVPGVAASGGANGAGLQVNIRGLQGMGRVKTMIDGTVQNASTYKGYPGNRDDTYIDPDLIATVDIKKGPDAGPQGAGVVGGIVSMRTIDARDIITDPEKNWGIRIKGMYGNNVATSKTMSSKVVNLGTSNPAVGYYNYYTYSMDRGTGTGGTAFRETYSNGVLIAPGDYVNDATLSNIGGGIPDTNYAGSIAVAWRPVDNWEITAAKAKRQSGNYYAGSKGAESWKGLRATLAGKEVYNTSLDSDTFLLKTKVRFLDDHTLELGYINYKNRSGYANARGGNESDYEWQQQLTTARSKSYTLNYAWQPDNPWFDLHWNIWKADLINDNALFTVTNRSVALHNDNIGGELWNANRIALPFGNLKLKYGVSYAREEASGDLEKLNYYDYVTGTALVNATRTNYGSFINADFTPTHWLSFNAGLQYSKTNFVDHKNKLRAFSGAPLVKQPDRSISSTTPSFGITLTPYEPVQIYAQYSRGARAPSLREMYIETNGIVPNADLKTEKAQNFEYGINLAFNGLLRSDDKLGVKLSRFENDYKDYIVRLSRLAMGENVAYSYKFSNIDQAKYKGLELSADYDAGFVFARLGWTYYDKVQYCYPEYNNATKMVVPSACKDQPPENDYGASYVPPSQERYAMLGFRAFNQKLTMGAIMKSATASMYGGTFRGSYIGKTIWDDYRVFDLFGSYEPFKNMEIGFSIENLTDRFYVPAQSDALSALPAPGRTARMTLTYKY